LLAGKPGRGKTHLCTALALRFAHQHMDVYMMRVSEGLEELMALKMEDMNEFKAKIDRIAKAKFLILDDLGTEKLTESKESAIFQIFDKRTELKEKNRTFITTNLSLEEIKEKFNERLISRIREICRIKNAKGEDYRNVINLKQRTPLKSIV
jgi:DNA replication protein DnaC